MASIEIGGPVEGFKPFTVAITFNTMKEYETFTGRMTRIVNGRSLDHYPTFTNPTPIIHDYQFGGGEGSEPINDEIYKKFKELKNQGL